MSELEKALQPGRAYRFTFLDSKSISGRLVKIDRYHLIVDTATSEGDTLRLLLYKHALRNITLGVVQQDEPNKGEVQP